MSTPIDPRKHGSESKPEQTEITIPVIQEELIVGKEVIETGRVLLEKSVTQEDVSFDVSLTEENYKVVRVPKNEDVDVAPAIRYEGDITIIPVVREVAVIQKKLVLVEEIHLRRTVVPREETITETLRTEEIEVKRTNSQ